jgi:putative FmdB family regulatory protein
VELLTILILDIIKTMPNYEYKCNTCGITREVFYSLDEDRPDPICCATAMSRVWGNTPVIFTGTGFYKTDNR